MHKLLSLALAAVALAALPSIARAAPVTWTFYETGCTLVSDGSACTTASPVPFPYALATLTMSGLDSVGSAIWSPGTNGSLPAAPPVITGDPNFSLDFTGISITPPSYGYNNTPCHLSLHLICDYDISWSEQNGQLSAVAITIETGDSDIGVLGLGGPAPFGLTGGSVATDGVIDNCEDQRCIVTGFWQSNLVPEPRSAALLLTGLLVAWVAWEAKHRRASPGSL